MKKKLGNMSMVPTGTGKTEKPGKMGFPLRGKSGNFTQNTGKSEKIRLENWKKKKKILEKSVKFVSQK